MIEERSGIPTEYRGVVFRSRLEAKWAITFDLLGIAWNYEAIDLEGYIPDFLLDCQLYSRPQVRGPVLVEVRPVIHADGFADPIAKIARSGWTGSAVVLGATLFPKETPWGIETTPGLGYPVVAPEHAEDQSKWYPVGWHSHRRQLGMGGDDLTAVWLEATQRSKWMPPR